MAIKDKRGKDLDIGAIVCFNYSGEVSIGQIVQIVPVKKYARYPDSNYMAKYKYVYHVRSHVGGGISSIIAHGRCKLCRGGLKLVTLR